MHCTDDTITPKFENKRKANNMWEAIKIELKMKIMKVPVHQTITENVYVISSECFFFFNQKERLSVSVLIIKAFPCLLPPNIFLFRGSMEVVGGT